MKLDIIQQVHDLNISKSIYRFIGALLTALLVIAIAACRGGESGCKPMSGDTLKLRHASLLSIVECGEYTVVDVKNPWKESLLHRYILVDKSKELPQQLPAGTTLRVPLDSILLLSTVHAELVCDLGCADIVKGVCEAQYMTQEPIVEALNSGAVIDCGSSLNVDLEKVVQLSPQAVWVMPYENGGYGKLEKLPYPLVECAEYMENSPIAAAEWMRFYGRLIGKAPQADSLFSLVESSYMALRDSVAMIANRPTLMCELKTASAWYVPGGSSTIGRIYNDAGADYIFSSWKQTGSVPLSFETVLDKAADADFWLIKYAGDEKRYSTLKNEYAGYVHFKPYRERNIYVCNLSHKRFYAETPFRPDILLRELVAIFHPQYMNQIELRYYEKMEE